VFTTRVRLSWFRRGRLFMVSPVPGDYRRLQAETPLIDLFKFAEPALKTGMARCPTRVRSRMKVGSETDIPKSVSRAMGGAHNVVRLSSASLVGRIAGSGHDSSATVDVRAITVTLHLMLAPRLPYWPVKSSSVRSVTYLSGLDTVLD
jgi:hypothetical protein